MVSFAEFLETAATKREFVNILFEERVFDLIGTLQKLSIPLEAAGVPHELVGGLAVFLHVENADSTHSSLTRDIDLMIRREDMARCRKSCITWPAQQDSNRVGRPCRSKFRRHRCRPAPAPAIPVWDADWLVRELGSPNSDTLDSLMPHANPAPRRAIRSLTFHGASQAR